MPRSRRAADARNHRPIPRLMADSQGRHAARGPVPTGTPGPGPVRERRPVYVDLMPPCNAGCPAGENIQAWLAHATAGRHEAAWRQLVEDNPFAAIHGRVCYHPCETVCNRTNLDSAVSIHSVERFLGDLARERGLDVRISPPLGPASESSSSARGRADCRPPTTWRASATRSRSATRGPYPAG